MDISGHVMKPNWRYYLHQIEGLCKSYVRGYTDITPKIWLTAHMVQYLRCLKWPFAFVGSKNPSNNISTINHSEFITYFMITSLVIVWGRHLACFMCWDVMR